MIKTKDAAFTAVDESAAQLVSQDSLNVQQINSHRKPGTRTLILAGSAHIIREGALVDLLKKEGSVDTMVYAPSGSLKT